MAHMKRNIVLGITNEGLARRMVKALGSRLIQKIPSGFFEVVLLTNNPSSLTLSRIRSEARRLTVWSGIELEDTNSN